MVTDTLDLLSQQRTNGERAAEPDFGIEYAVVDFSDAFLTLRLAEEERGYAVITDGKGKFYAYKGFPFGFASGPLLWGRVAAFFGRLAQATLRNDDEARIQIFVDDPIVSIAGSQRERTWTAAVVFLCWAMLGAKLAWHKASFGHRTLWTGAEYSAEADGILVAIDAARIEKLLEAIGEARSARGLIKDLQKLAGQMSWVAGIAPRIRPFVAHLWAAIYSEEAQRAKVDEGRSSARKRPKGAVFLRRVDYALEWLEAFAKGERGGLQRRHLLRDRTQEVGSYIRTDASTTGFAGVLLSASGEPQEFWAERITAEDRAVFKAAEDESAFMPEYELMAILISVKLWGARLVKQSVAFAVQADSCAALGVAIKLASPRPLMNAVAAELALELETLGVHTLMGEHYRSILNVEADALSRLWSGAEGAQVPRSLRLATRVQAPPRGREFFRAWPREWHAIAAAEVAAMS